MNLQQFKPFSLSPNSVEYRKLVRFARSTTARLGLSYLAIIMLMSIGFSVVFYDASTHELGRVRPHDDNPAMMPRDEPRIFDPAVKAFLDARAKEAHDALLRRLIVLNVLALAGGSLLSYYLARRTLEPIERNMEAQAQFVSDASHELRTPLTTLQTTNEVAARRKKIASDDAKEIFRHNVIEVAKLQQLTDSLLKLARSDHTQVVFAPVQVPTLVSDALNAVVLKAQEKNIGVEDTVPNMSVPAEKASLTQAVVTILDNAIKYSPEKSTIFITAEKHGKHALLHIRDEGKGISDEHLPHIFDRFYRADESRNKIQHDGYGIGLALAHKIIEQHHGELSVESTVGNGSTFTIKLPLS